MERIKNRGRFFQLDGIMSSHEFICTDKYLTFCNFHKEISYYKRDFIYRSGFWREKKISSLLNFKLKPTKLVIGHSDKSTNKMDLTFLRFLGIEKVVSTNSIQVGNFSLSIPIGLTNHTRESHNHQLFGDIKHFKIAHNYSSPIISNKDFYVNFNEKTSRKRSELLIILKQLSDRIYFEEPDYSDNGRIKFLVNLRKFKMVICPEGNGHDTHRFWETIYMGGIPVVKKNRYLSNFHNYLPCVILNSWSELKNRELIEVKLALASEKLWDNGFMLQSYWNRRILNF